MKYSLYVLLISCITLSSCLKDKYDLSNPNLNYSPTFAAPIVTAKVKVKDLLSALASDLITPDENGLLRFIFSDTLMEINLDEVLEIPNFSQNYAANLAAISLPNQNIQSAITLGDAAQNFEDPFDDIIQDNDKKKIIIPFQSGIMDIGRFNVDQTFEDFEYADFETGEIEVILTNNWDVDLLNIKVSLVNIVNNVPIPLDTFDFGTIPSGGSSTVLSTLANKRMYQSLELHLFSFQLPQTQDSVYIDLDEVLAFNVNTSNLSIKGGSVKINEHKEVSNDIYSIPFDFTNGENIEKLLIKGGEFNLNLNFGIGENARIEFTIPAATKNNQIFTQTININGFNNSPLIINENFDLSGFELDLSQTANPNEIEIKIKTALLGSNQFFTFDITQEINTEVTLNNLGISYIQGYFGQQEIDFLNNTANLEFGQNELLTYFNFVEPQIRMFFDNGFGIPFNLDINMELEGSKGVSNLDLSSILSGFIVTPAPSLGLMATSSFSIGKDSDLGTALNNNPYRANASGKVLLNPQGQTTNFAQDTSKLRVRVELEVPLYGTINNYTVTDTIDIELESILKNFKQAALRTIITNDLPINAQIQAYFTDENFTILDSIAVNKLLLIESAVVNNEGDLVESKKKINDIVLDKEKNNRVKNTKHIIIKIIVNSPENGTIAGKIYEDHELSVKISAIAQLDINLNE